MRTAVWFLCFVLCAAADRPDSTVTVPAGGDLQKALAAARPGDTVLLEPGATYVGNFVLPARRGEGDGFITVRTSGSEGLPGPGERISPDAAARLAKLRSPNNRPALRTEAGAHHWRIALLEFQASRNGAGDIVELGDGSSAQRSLDRVPSDLVLDRLYIHGDPDRGQKRAVALNSRATTISGCYIADIKAIGQDSQAIGGWNGPGGYTIENNYLEAAGENVMFGGADPAIPDLVPQKIVVRGNTISKATAWREAGGPKWQVKNLFELKNARDVDVEGNVFERSWQQAQAGYAIVFTVRNQDGACPWCVVENVDFHSNIVRDVAGGLVVLGTDPNHPSRPSNHITIRDNLFDGVDRSRWGGDGYVFVLSDSPRDLVIDHNTIVQGASNGLVKISHGRVEAFRMTNNVAGHGQYGIAGRDRRSGNDTIGAYLPGAVITRNVMAGGPASAYPAGNLFPSVDEFRRQFAGFGDHDYRLTPRSSWIGAGTDKRDLGADVTKLPASPQDSQSRPSHSAQKS